MKYLDKFISFIFALAVLVLAVTIILVSIGQVNVDTVFGILHNYVFAEEVKQTALITAIVVAMAALKVTVFNSSFKKNDKSPILVETNHGMIEISQDTIENTVKSVATEFPEIKDVQARMVKKQKGIKIDSSISVLANTNIRALTGELQERIEQVIDETTGIKILSTNIKVKNIYDKSRKSVKSETKEVIKEEIAENQKTQHEDVHEVTEEVREEVATKIEETVDNSLEVKE